MANVDNIKIVRLSSGEEIVGEVVSQNDKVVEVKNPVRIVVIPSKADPNNPSIAFAPFMQWSEDKVLTLNAAHVITVVNPLEDFINQYNGLFGGLVVPPKSGIITP